MIVSAKMGALYIVFIVAGLLVTAFGLVPVLKGKPF
jgi:hypothetical protein